MVFFRSEFFFQTTREFRIFFFFCGAKHEICFLNLTLAYMTKTLNQIYFFSSTKIRIFFQQQWESEYFFRKKNHSPLPPWKLNGPSPRQNLWGSQMWNLTKFTPLFLLLICHGMEEVRKPHYGHMRAILCTIQWKWWLKDYESVTKLLCMLPAIWLVKKGDNLYLSYYVGSIACDTYWCFLRSPTPQHISKVKIQF